MLRFLTKFQMCVLSYTLSKIQGRVVGYTGGNWNQDLSFEIITVRKPNSVTIDNFLYFS